MYLRSRWRSRILNQRQTVGADHRDDKSGEAHKRKCDREGLQRLHWGHASHRGNLPKATIIHPRKWFGSAADRERDVDSVERQLQTVG